MRRLIFSLALTTGLLAIVPSVQAQNPIGSSDPFFLYYGYFLPRQQSIAAMQQGSSMAIINSNSEARAFTAPSRQLDQDFNLRPLGMDELDPNAPIGYGRSQGSRYSGPAILSPGQQGVPQSPIYHNRTAGYFPGLRTGAPTPNAAAGGLGFGGARPMARPMGGMGAMGDMGGMGGFR